MQFEPAQSEMVTCPHPGIPTPFLVLQDTQEESGPGTLIF